MPISNEEFQRGREREALKDRVRRFLYENDDRAFTVYEISDEVGFIASAPPSHREQPTDMAAVSVQVVLLGLFDNGIVDSRIVDDGDVPKRYYKAQS